MSSFFHLTQLGYQQPIKSAVLSPPVAPPPERLKLPEIENYGKGARKSQEAHRLLRTKHTRQPNDAHELYRVPVATTMDYGEFSSNCQQHSSY